MDPFVIHAAKRAADPLQRESRARARAGRQVPRPLRVRWSLRSNRSQAWCGVRLPFLTAMAHLLRECLSDGSGHWEPAPSKPAPYTLARPPKLSHYAPQACDKPGQPSTRSVLRHSWVPTGPRCAALRQQHAPWLNTTLETLAARFCKRHNGSKILLVGDSIMSQWFLGLAASLGAPAFSSATTRACGSSGGALDYDVGQTAVACKGGGVRLRYVRNGVLDVNATAEAAGRASQGGCVPDPSSTNQPWVYLAAQSDFVVLNRGVWVEQDDQVFVAQARAHPRPHTHRP